LVGLALLVGGLELSAGWSNTGVVLCITPLSFELNRRWVWTRRDTRRQLRHAVPFFAFSLAGLVLSSLSVWEASSMTIHESRAVHSLAVVLANLAAFGFLWIAQYLVVDHLVFPSGDSSRSVLLAPSSQLG
jgi:putative flippase GtrA